MDEAASRELKRVDPIYFEADEDGANIYGNYSAVADGYTRESEYAQATSLDDAEDTYDLGNANVYAASNPGALIYDTASGAANDAGGCIYDNQMGEVRFCSCAAQVIAAKLALLLCFLIYSNIANGVRVRHADDRHLVLLMVQDAIYDGMQDSMGNGIYGAADSEELYALADAGAAEEPVYGFANNTSDESQAIYDNTGGSGGDGAIYGNPEGAIYGNPDHIEDATEGAIYDNNADDETNGFDGEIYDNTADTSRIDSIYGSNCTSDRDTDVVKTLERPEYDGGAAGDCKLSCNEEELASRCSIVLGRA